MKLIDLRLISFYLMNCLSFTTSRRRHPGQIVANIILYFCSSSSSCYCCFISLEKRFGSNGENWSKKALMNWPTTRKNTNDVSCRIGEEVFIHGLKKLLLFLVTNIFYNQFYFARGKEMQDKKRWGWRKLRDAN